MEDEDKKYGKPWPSHSSREGLNKELLEAGITVGLTYIITPIEDKTESLHQEGK